jgi:hypothetical protein
MLKIVFADGKKAEVTITHDDLLSQYYKLK